MKGLPDSYTPDDLEHVPTLPELVSMKLASVLERNMKGEPVIVRPTPEGQQLIYETMARNAEKRRHHEGVREGTGNG